MWLYNYWKKEKKSFEYHPKDFCIRYFIMIVKSHHYIFQIWNGCLAECFLRQLTLFSSCCFYFYVNSKIDQPDWSQSIPRMRNFVRFVKWMLKFKCSPSYVECTVFSYTWKVVRLMLKLSSFLTWRLKHFSFFFKKELISKSSLVAWLQEVCKQQLEIG